MPHECTDCGRAFDDGSKEMLSGCPRCGGNTFQFRPEGTGLADRSGEPPDPPEPAVDGMARTVGNAASAVRNLVGGPRSGSEPTVGAGPEDEAQASARGEVFPSDYLSTSGGRDSAGTDSGADDIIVPDETDLNPQEGAPQSTAWGAATGSAEETNSEDSSPDRSERPRPSSGDDGVDQIGTETAESGERITDPPTTETADSPADAREQSSGASTSANADATPGTGRSADQSPGDGGTGSSAPDGTTMETAERPGLAELREELNDQFESIRVLEPGQYELNLMELYDREEYIIALQEDGKYTIQVPDRWND